MDLCDLYGELERGIEFLEAETARLNRSAEAGNSLDLSWFARLHSLTCMLTAARAIAQSLIESDVFVLTEVKHDSES
ncbi:MAG: hypothetical protein ACYC6M_09125 [Terriglobales bacterium]